MKIKTLLKCLAIIIIMNTHAINLHAETSIYKLTAKKITYQNNNQLTIAVGDAEAKDQYGKTIQSEEIIYDKKKSIIRTKSKSKYSDNSGNIIFADDFFYEINLKKIIAKKNVKYQDKNNNILFFSKFEYYENSEFGYGENIKGTLADNSSIEAQYAEIDNKKEVIILKNETNTQNILKKIFSKNNNNYTTCLRKKTKTVDFDKECPDWSLSTFKTKHDTKKKMFYHEQAIVKIKNFPVFYTPYFSHPDPSVKRKSGFLPPSTKNFENIGRTAKIPYFFEINDNSDLTFTPIIYENENSIFLTEYRKQNKHSNLFLDTSYSKGYKNINKKGDDGQNLNRTGGSRNHFFLNFLGNFDDIIFGNNDISLQIQRISQKNFLKVNEINTEIAKQDIDTLDNFASIISYEKNKRLKISTSVYETLSDDNKNTKYQYTFPNVEYNNFFNFFNQSINHSNILQTNIYNGDSKKTIQRNTLNSESKQKIIKKIGIGNIFKTKISNINYYNDNTSLAQKQNLNNELYTTFALESTFPLFKIDNYQEQTIIPKILTKFTTGSMKDESNIDKILTYSDIYSMDRLNNLDNPETGGSIGYGIEYALAKKSSLDRQYLSSFFSIGQIFSDVQKNKMPNNSSLNQKSSNIVGNFNLTFDNDLYQNKDSKLDKNEIIFNNYGNSGIKFNYNFNLSNNLDKILKNDLAMSINSSRERLNLSYYELHDLGNSQYIEGVLEKSIENNFNFKFGIKRNLELNYTENNFIETNYETDCIKIGLNLSKKFYQSNDLQKSNNLTLFVMLKPFGQPIAPDLTNLISN